MNRLKFAFFILAVFCVGVTVSPPVIGATNPPEPSYEDQWMQADAGSSPFLDLRNETDTDEPEGPEPPDTPTVEPVEDTGVDDDVTVSSPDTVADSDEDDSTAGSEPEKTSSSENREADQTPKEQPSEKTDKPPTRDRRTKSEETSEPSETTEVKDRSSDRANGILKELSPLEVNGVTPAYEVTSGTLPSTGFVLSQTDLNAEPSSSPDRTREAPGWWWRYRYWLLGGLVVSIMTGMFFWFRRRRVTVIERNYVSAEEFFKDELKRRRPTVSESSRNSERRTPERSPEEETPQTGRQSDTFQVLMDRLDDHGIDKEYRTLIEKYYREGLSRREVAEASSLGNGEVGLVLDLADRIREEVTYGAGS